MHNLRLLRFDSQDTNISKAFKRQVRKSTPRVKKKLNLRPDYLLAKRAKFISTKSSSETFLQAKTTNKCKNTPFKRPSSEYDYSPFYIFHFRVGIELKNIYIFSSI